LPWSDELLGGGGGWMDISEKYPWDGPGAQDRSTWKVGENEKKKKKKLGKFSDITN
jgi:hypothetical protein